MTAEADVQQRVLEALEGAQNYNAWLADLIRPFVGESPIEVGSGIGTNARLLLERGVPKVTLSEPDETAAGDLRRRFAGDPRVEVRTVELVEASDAEFSACVALNVLEHIDDDVGALRGALRLVRPGGYVVMFVPAFAFAAGRFDRLIGHRRRYTRSTLAAVYVKAGVEVERVRYVNAPGLIAWFLAVRLLRQVPREGPLLRAWDGAIIPLVRRAERAWSPPFGQSVLAVGRRPL